MGAVGCALFGFGGSLLFPSFLSFSLWVFCSGALSGGSFLSVPCAAGSFSPSAPRGSRRTARPYIFFANTLTKLETRVKIDSAYTGWSNPQAAARQTVRYGNGRNRGCVARRRLSLFSVFLSGSLQIDFIKKTS